MDEISGYTNDFLRRVIHDLVAAQIADNCDMLADDAATKLIATLRTGGFVIVKTYHCES